MLISHEYKFIFIKTRKTAGSSLERYLLPYAQVGPTIDKWEDKHVPVSVILNHIGTEKWKSYTRIVAFRNPWDQVVSLYHWRGRKRKFSALLKKFFTGRQIINSAAKLSFQEWVKYKRNELNENRNIIYLDEKLPPYKVVRFEYLKEDLEKLCEKLGIPYEEERLLNLKGGIRPKRDYREYYDEETTEIVRLAFSQEIEDFDYTF